ncbi:MAG: hypothetical protein ACJAYB_003026 [Psychromonas sp.]
MTANQVELALGDYYNDIKLVTECLRQLAEVDNLPTQIAAFYQEQRQETDLSVVRSLMRCLVFDLQWVIESKRVVCFNKNHMRRNIVAIFLCAFILFFSPSISPVLFSLEF